MRRTLAMAVAVGLLSAVRGAVAVTPEEQACVDLLAIAEKQEARPQTWLHTEGGPSPRGPRPAVQRLDHRGRSV